jgi:hypothetical protein
MATAITFVLSNAGVLLFAVALVRTLLRVRHGQLAHRVVTPSYVLWGETLFYAVGVTLVYIGILHAYFQHIAAPSIGWHPSPFEYELGWFEIPLGVVAMLSLWRGYEFRLAATIIFVVFSWAAAAQHIAQILGAHNYAPGNAGPILWFGDILLPLLLVVLAFVSRDAHERFERT